MNDLGLPVPRSGSFADVYQFKGGDGKTWALKCFTRKVAGLRERYAKIDEHLILLGVILELYPGHFTHLDAVDIDRGADAQSLHRTLEIGDEGDALREGRGHPAGRDLRPRRT